MNKPLTPKVFVWMLSTMLCLAAAASGQNPQTQDVKQANRAQAEQPPGEGRPNLLQELGLSRQQLQQVRRINQERKPLEQAARQRFQSAQRALNMAIYSDDVSDADVQSRLKEFQSAQAELARIKFTNELAVRKVLTGEQLVKFRELRRRFAEARDELREAPPAGRRLRRMRRGGGPPLN